MNKLALALFAVALLPVSAQAADEPRITGTLLSLSAEAKAHAAPDIATISAGVVTSAPRADKAMQDNATKMDAVFKAMKAAGIADKDIQTSGINVSPQYAYKENAAPRITGYQVNNEVSVKLHDLKAIGNVLDALIAQGANQINGPHFSVENPDVVLDAARKEAMAKVQKRAELYATAAGLKIKRIVSIAEQTGGYQPPVRPMMMKASMAADMAEASTPVAAGEMTMETSVSVEYELAP